MSKVKGFLTGLFMFCLVGFGMGTITYKGYEVVRGIIADADTGKTAIVSDSQQLSVSSFLVEVAKGNVPGHMIVNKFGHNPAVPTTGADIWGGGGTYAFYPTTAQTMTAQSTSANDDVAGTGARTVIFYGLDANWELAQETIEMDGTTGVVLTNTYTRMFRGIVVSVGTAESNLGAITVTGGGDTAIYIDIDDGQTQQAIYTIPAGYTAMFLKGYVALGNDNKNGVDGTFQWQGRLNNGFTGAWATKGQVTLVNIGSSHFVYEYGAPAGMLPEKTDIRIRVTDTDATIDGIGGYDLLLVQDGY